MLLDDFLKFGLRGKVGEVFGYKDLLREASGGVFDKRFFLAGAEDDADRRVITFLELVFLVIIEIDVHLAGIGVGKFADLQVDEDMAFEDAVIKNQVDPIVGVAECDAFLARLKTESAA